MGKTSLITAAATESFPDCPPPVLPPTRLPAEATPEGVPMVIVDTSSREEEKTSLDVSCAMLCLARHTTAVPVSKFAAATLQLHGGTLLHWC